MSGKGGIEINLSSNFLEAGEAFGNQLTGAQLTNAGRRALNRTLLTMRKFSIGEIRSKMRIKQSELIGRGLVKMEKASGGSLGGLKAAMVYDSKPLPLIFFLRGAKRPSKQKGVKVKRRKAPKVEIIPGRVVTVKQGFVQRTRKGGLQIFKRGKGKSTTGGDKIKAQGTRSVGFLVANRGIGDMTADIGRARFTELFNAELRARVAGFVKEVSTSEAGRRGGSAR